MTVTVPIQVMLDHRLVQAIDARATSTKMTRADVLRELLATALATPQAAPASTIDPLLNRILDALARLDVKVDECGEAVAAPASTPSPPTRPRVFTR